MHEKKKPSNRIEMLLWKNLCFWIVLEPFVPEFSLIRSPDSSPELNAVLPMLVPMQISSLWPLGFHSDVLSRKVNAELKVTVKSNHACILDRHIFLFKCSRHFINMQGTEIASLPSPSLRSVHTRLEKDTIFLKFRIKTEIYFNVLAVLSSDCQISPWFI